MTKNVLVVDDDPVIRALMTDLLSSVGHTVQAFASGEEALARLKHELPDFIILDLQMPTMNGIEVLTRLRASERTSALPVIMLSANSDTASLSEGSSIKADYYLEKPFNVAAMLTLIQGMR